MKPPVYALACVLIVAVASMPASAARVCQQVLSVDPERITQKELHVTEGANGLPIKVAKGKLSINDANSLVPDYESDCGTQVSGSLAEDRVRLDMAAPSSNSGSEESVAETASGIDGYAGLAADLTAPASPVSSSLAVSFLSTTQSGSGRDRRYLGGHTRIGLFDERIQTSAEFATSVDDGEGEDDTGLAGKYEVSIDLWQGDGFDLSSFAGLSFADSHYADGGSDVTADRLTREIGATMHWGRLDLSLSNSLATDNLDGDNERPQGHWTTWNSQVGLDLSGLHRFLPRNVKLGFEFERFQEPAGHTSSGANIARSVDLELGWQHHGGTTALEFGQAIERDRNTGGEETGASQLEIGFGRSIATGAWRLWAKGVLVQEVATNSHDTDRDRSFDLDVSLGLDPSPSESLGFEVGFVVDEESEGSTRYCCEASLRLSYGLSF